MPPAGTKVAKNLAEWSGRREGITIFVICPTFTEVPGGSEAVGGVQGGGREGGGGEGRGRGGGAVCLERHAVLHDGVMWD